MLRAWGVETRIKLIEQKFIEKDSFCYDFKATVTEISRRKYVKQVKGTCTVWE